MKPRLTFCLLAVFALFATGASAATILDRPVENLRLEKAPLSAAFRALGHASQTTIIIEPDISGEVTLDLTNANLRTALAALTEPFGYHYEASAGWITIKRFKTVLYQIDYPQLIRSGSGSASITLGGNSNNSYGDGYSDSQYYSNRTTRTDSDGRNGSGSDVTQVSISQENQNTFWANLETELRSMLREGESLVLNRFSGIAQITAPARRHAVIRAFIELTNRRITQQVEIDAQLVEVSLRDERKLGVDWELAGATIKDVALGASAPLDLAGLGGNMLSGNSLVANLGFGSKASAVIQALQQQGDVTTVSQQRLRALNNQTAFIKVGQDQPFFRLQQSTSLTQAGNTNPVNQTQNTYSVSTITIGTILAITPQIGADGVITLDVLPAITRLQSVVTSPDGMQTAPAVEVKQASTIVRLRDGETVVIGGLIADEQAEGERAVPLLSSVPVLGRAFRTQATTKHRSELVIFLTPRLIK